MIQLDDKIVAENYSPLPTPVEVIIYFLHKMKQVAVGSFLFLLYVDG